MEIRFGPDDLKLIEDTIARGFARGIVSAIKALAKEGLFSGLNGTAYAPLAPDEPPAEPQFGQHLERKPDQPAPRFRKKRRSYTEVCKTVAHRPQGYITLDRAREILATPNADATIRAWVLDRRLPAVIAADQKPPAKGLPGRLVVEMTTFRTLNGARLAELERRPWLASGINSHAAV